MIIKKIPIKNIKPAAYNPRIDLQPTDPAYIKLKKSLDEFGVIDLLIWNKRTKNLVGGHQRLKIMIESGATEAEVSVVDLNLTKEKALNLALNKTGGDWNNELLADLFVELKVDLESPDVDFSDIEITGFNMIEVDDILAEFGEHDLGKEPDGDPDAVPDVKPDPITKMGDIYKIGRHRLMCGDSTDEAQVAALMDGKKADMLFTDPPYGINTSIANDDLSEKELIVFNEKWAANIDDVLVADAHVVCFHSTRLFWSALKAIQDNGFKFLRYLTLYKPNDCTFPWQGWILKSESILLFAKGSPKYIKVEPYLHDTMQHLHGAEQKKERGGHPCCKPFSFLSEFLKRFEGGIVLDLFGGSGTTLIACEGQSRQCYMMELDPAYCDVIVQRYKDLFGDEGVGLVKKGS